MTGLYVEKDLSIIIPTLGINEARLRNLITAIKEESSVVKIIVVWDNIDDISSTLKGFFSLHSIHVICHTVNKGRAAARNTGISHCKTLLGMFIDDDILPENIFIKKVISFHNQNLSELDMIIGKVTWQGSEHQSPLTDWYETAGNWNLFTNSTHMQLLSNFMTGFTSFKSSVFERLPLDESFKKYGSEDTEFGYRFFGQGGLLYFSEEIVGIHDKALPLSGYCKQHIEAGFSKALLSTIHPDLVFKMDYFYQATCLYNMKDNLDLYISHAELLLEQHRENIVLNTHLDANMSFLTEICMAIGFIDYYKERYQSIHQNINLLLNCTSFTEFCLRCVVLTDIPFFLIEMSAQEKNIELKTSLLLASAEKLPNYAKPLIELVHLNKDKWLNKLCEFYDERHESLDLNTKITIDKLLNSNTEVDVRNLSARERYLYLLKNNDVLSPSEINALCESIITSDPTFVSAYIFIAKMNFNANPDKANMYLKIASFFAKIRPLNEKLLRQREIKELESELRGKI